ncbi:hypothetical protein ACOME3_007324 [Neoechinorhynchus agilis]
MENALNEAIERSGVSSFIVADDQGLLIESKNMGRDNESTTEAAAICTQILNISRALSGLMKECLEKDNMYDGLGNRPAVAITFNNNPSECILIDSADNDRRGTTIVATMNSPQGENEC